VFWCLCRYLSDENRQTWAIDRAFTVLHEAEAEFADDPMSRRLLEYASKKEKPLIVELRPNKFGYESRGVSALQAAYMASHADESSLIGEQSIRDAFKAVKARQRPKWLRETCELGVALTEIGPNPSPKP